MKSIVLLMAIVMGACLHGADPIAPERNSALQYWIAFAMLPKNEPEWLKEIQLNKNKAAPLEAEQANSWALKYLHSGAACPGGTFGSVVGVENFGVESIMPHIGSVRFLSRLALARATWRFEHGKSAEAIDDCLAVLAMVADLSNQSFLIEVLVAYSVQSAVINTLGRNMRSCTPIDRAKLADRLNDARLKINNDDFMRNESLQWRKILSRPDSLLVWIKVDAGINGNPSITPEVVAKIKANDPQISVWINEVEIQLAEASKLTPKLITLTRDEYLNELKRLAERKGEANPLQKMAGGESTAYIDVIRRSIVRKQLLQMAAAAFDQPGGLTRLEGFKTIEGGTTVTSEESFTRLTVTRSDQEKAIELTIGQPPPKGSVPTSDANDF